MFHDKTILITGASSGLGQALAIAFAELGANVVLMARHRENLMNTKSLCLRRNVNNKSILLVVGDVRKEEDCKKAIADTMDTFEQLDYLILNAGVSMWARFDSLENINVVRELIETNYLAAVQCVFHALPFLKASHGMIVAISSIQGKFGTAYYSGYTASKHALEGFLQAIRMELENSVDVLTVSPTWINDTDLKKNALGHKRSAEVLQKQKRAAMSLDYCVKKIIAAMQKRKTELILPSKYRLVPWLKLFCPGLLNSIVRGYLE